MSDVPYTWRVSLTTFNCAKAFPFGQQEVVSNIAKKLLPKAINHDMYVIGLQEFAAIWQGSFPNIVEPLLISLADHIIKYLNSQSRRKYSLAGSSNTGAIGLIVIADESFVKKQVATCNYRCGYFWSNLKGAVAICCTLERMGGKPEVFTFICNHLTANKGEAYKLQRIQDYNAVLAACTEQFRLMSFNEGHVFFMGDLNFRLEGLEDLNTDYASPEDLLEISRNRDELNVCKRKGLIFQGFEEADIRFPPTYKYITEQSNKFDLKRMPAWCDRILFKEYSGSNYTIDSYTSVERTPDLQFSDHKAVRLVIEIPQLSTALTTNPLRSLPPAQSSLIGDVADTVFGYGGWAAANKIHYWIVLFLIGFLIIRIL